MPRQKTNKTKLTITVDKNLIESAKEINMNLSAFLELKLIEFLSF
jgi:post-segregation antitoxin (ccd killing protein)